MSNVRWSGAVRAQCPSPSRVTVEIRTTNFRLPAARSELSRSSSRVGQRNSIRPNEEPAPVHQHDASQQLVCEAVTPLARIASAVTPVNSSCRLNKIAVRPLRPPSSKKPAKPEAANPSGNNSPDTTINRSNPDKDPPPAKSSAHSSSIRTQTGGSKVSGVSRHHKSERGGRVVTTGQMVRARNSVIRSARFGRSTTRVSHTTSRSTSG